MPIAAASVDYVRSLIRDEAGIVLDPAKVYLVESRLRPLARRANVADLDAFVGLARGALGANLRRQVVAAMTTGETSFFRDVALFGCLRAEVLPALIAARRAERSLAIWCSAASTGQEPYSIAMIIHEHFPELLSWKLTFIASDLSVDALARARSGRYNQIEINRGLPATLADKYFECQGLEWAIAARLRSMVTFQELNLIKPWPAFPPLDIVVLRDAMQHFDVETRRRTIARARDVLRPDGCVFLGSAETAMTPVDGFERVGADRSGWFRARQDQDAAL